MKEKLLTSILAVIIIVCVLAFVLAFCLGACDSDNSEKKGKYKESLVYVTGFTKPYVLLSYTVDDNGIITINAYRFVYSYEASV